MRFHGVKFRYATLLALLVINTGNSITVAQVPPPKAISEVPFSFKLESDSSPANPKEEQESELAELYARLSALEDAEDIKDIEERKTQLGHIF
jgi:hypothetical protein